MFDKLEIMQMARAMASHAALRQNAISQNVANADTPGYAARDVANFADTYESANDEKLKATRPSHLNSDTHFSAQITSRRDAGAMSPNGNSVSLEEEMVKGVEVKQQHDLALAIYKSSMNILRTSLGRA
ncbi:FlgB family protein [Phaeovulum sp.]|uniref:FlgB family protein n=1 Tax=Phaeovulum sp. TaxID=2934796 RepID=UPI0039E40C78